MKKIIFILIFIFSMSFSHISFSDSTAEEKYIYTTIINNLSWDYLFYNVFYSYRTSLKRVGGGGESLVTVGNKNDGVFELSDSSDSVIKISLKGESNENDFCTLSYNVQNSSVAWIINSTYQFENTLPPIKCSYKLYKNHLFVFIDEVKK